MFAGWSAQKLCIGFQRNLDAGSFGVDPDKEMGPGHFFSLSLTLGIFLTFLLITQGITSGS